MYSRSVVAAAGFSELRICTKHSGAFGESFFGVEELYLKNGIEMSGKDFLFHSHYVFFGARFSSFWQGGVCLCAWNPSS